MRSIVETVLMPPGDVSEGAKCVRLSEHVLHTLGSKFCHNMEFEPSRWWASGPNIKLCLVRALMSEIHGN